MPSEPVVPAEPVPEEPDMPSACKNASKRKSKQIAADGSAESSKKVTKAKKSTAGAGKKPPAGPGGPGGDDSADGNRWQDPQVLCEKAEASEWLQCKQVGCHPPCIPAHGDAPFAVLQCSRGHRWVDILCTVLSLNFPYFWFWCGLFSQTMTIYA